jgi:type I restriction-modification system DNA methylase subunit
MTNYFNEVSKYFDQLGRRHDLSSVFNELLTMAICSYHRTNIQSRLQVKDAANEELYMKTIAKYEIDEINTFPKILGCLHLQVHNEPYSDVLGEYFMQNITHGQNGQFFTPGPICEMMAKMQNGEESIENNRVHDPACGSGRTLLAFAKHNPNNYFFGADNSNTCAKMTALNFFLNGMSGEVAWMNSLSMEWYGGWHINMEGLGILPIEKEQSVIWTKPPEPNNILLPIEQLNDVQKISGKAAQLELF